MAKDQSLYHRIRLKANSLQQRRVIAGLARQAAERARIDPEQRPVVIFNASTRLTGLSLNAAFALLTGWSLRLAGVPVVHFVCQAGLQPCVLGTNREDYTSSPPCESCVAQSQRLYQRADVHPFHFQPDPELEAALQNLSMEQLSNFSYAISYGASDSPATSTPPSPLSLPPIPIGIFALPSFTDSGGPLPGTGARGAITGPFDESEGARASLAS
ncbi:MAG: hypothetical protein ACWGO1_07495, partial [Anaerolineales bacterium]